MNEKKLNTLEDVVTRAQPDSHLAVSALTAAHQAKAKRLCNQVGLDCTNDVS
jgi:hypothetical protein